MSTKPRTIDDYLSGLSADKRAALDEVRAAIRSAAPKAEERIAYGYLRSAWTGRSSSPSRPPRDTVHSTR